MTGETVGFIGLGMMGSAMATRLQDAGVPLAVFNRTREKADPLIRRGARWCATPAEVAAGTRVIFSMLSDSAALSDVALSDSGVLHGAGAGALHVDCSTVAPSTTEALSKRYTEREVFFVHCPVLGSVPQAAQGALLLFAGGPSAGIDRAEPLLRVLGSHLWRFGQAGQASHAKLICNSFIAGMITTLGQALVFAEEAGISPSTILDILRHSALDAPMYQSKGHAILSGNFNPRFFLEHMLKDITLMLEAADQLGVHLPAIEVSRRLYQRAVDLGLAREDYSAVVKALRKGTGNAPH